MQYGKPDPKEKFNSSLEFVTFPWINFCGYNFNIMNTLHVFAANTSKCWKKTCSIFQITISRLPVKAKIIYIQE